MRSETGVKLQFLKLSFRFRNFQFRYSIHVMFCTFKINKKGLTWKRAQENEHCNFMALISSKNEIFSWSMLSLTVCLGLANNRINNVESCLLQDLHFRQTRKRVKQRKLHTFDILIITLIANARAISAFAKASKVG